MSTSFRKHDLLALSVIGLFCLYLFWVLEIPAGRHHVLLEFDPWTIKAVTGLTLLTAFLLLAFPLFRRVKRKTLP